MSAIYPIPGPRPPRLSGSLAPHGRKALKPHRKWPEDTSNPQVHGHLASTRAHAGWFTRRCVELPSTNPTKSIQNQYNNHTTTIQQPDNNHTTTVQQPRLTAYNSAHEPQHDATCDATESPRHETHPPPYRPPARPPPPPTYPKDPKGGAGATPRHTAPRRGGAGGGRRPTRRAAPTPRTPPPRTPRAAPVARCHPSPHCALRRGEGGRRPEAYPKGRHNPAGPQRRHQRHPSPPCATSCTARRAGEGGRWPTRRAAPTVKKVTPRPLR